MGIIPNEELTSIQKADFLRSQIKAAINYTETRIKVFRRWSSGVRVLALLMSGGATVILGLQDLDFWASLGFILVALTTVVSGIETFFNWRTRWVMAEECQAAFHRIEEGLDYLVVSKGKQISSAELDSIFAEYQTAWRNFNKKWVVERQRTGIAPY